GGGRHHGRAGRRRRGACLPAEEEDPSRQPGRARPKEEDRSPRYGDGFRGRRTNPAGERAEGGESLGLGVRPDVPMGRRRALVRARPPLHFTRSRAESPHFNAMAATKDSYAIISLGGKQYRVREGERLLVDRLKTDEGKTFNPA